MGAEVIEMDTASIGRSRTTTPNPKTAKCCTTWPQAVKNTAPISALGFDGDGDRCGVVDDQGDEIFADKIGLMLARDCRALHKNATFVAT
jgi:phosphomannomutase/phosphoglucomutase